MAGRIPWVFVEPTASEDSPKTELYFLPVNPTEDSGSHGIDKATKYEAAASIYVDTSNTLRINDTVIQDAPSQQETFAYTGTVYMKEQYDLFLHWFNKPDPWILRDDLGRTFFVIVDKYSTERVRSRKFPWKHTYSFSGIVLEGF